jgi:putative ABC transport system permease protein
MIPYHYAIREISRRKSRTISNIAGFAIGIAALVTLVMAARGWEASTTGLLRTLGADIVFIYPGPKYLTGPTTSANDSYVALGLFAYPFNTTIINDLSHVPGVERAVPVLINRMMPCVYSITLCGIDPSETTTNVVLPSHVVEGRYLTTTDRGVALVDRDYALKYNLTVGSKVTYYNYMTAYKKSNYTVVGIVEVGAMSLIRSTIYVNLPDAQEAVKAPGQVNIALLRVDDPGKLQAVSGNLTRLWPTSTVITASDIAAVTAGVITMSEQTAWNISLALAAVALLIGLKSQLSAVVERTREIGYLKAIGWSNSDVMGQIMTESFLQGLIGGLVGCAVGYAGALYVLLTIRGELGGALQFITVDPLLLGIALAIAVVSGVLAGIYPAWRSAKMNPAEALRGL